MITNLYNNYLKKYDELVNELKGTNLERIIELSLEVHSLIHPSNINEKSISDIVFDYMINGHQNDIVEREIFDTDLHYAGCKKVPICWIFYHCYRIEDLVSNIIMKNQEQIFNDDWKKRLNIQITDTANALNEDEVIEFGKHLNINALKEYMIEVSDNTRNIISNLTLEEINSKVPEEWIMNVLEDGGVTTDFKSIWLLVFWGRLTRGEMILTPLTNHHMIHLPVCFKLL